VHAEIDWLIHIRRRDASRAAPANPPTQEG
jgi:hypothetical protein